MSCVGLLSAVLAHAAPGSASHAGALGGRRLIETALARRFRRATIVRSPPRGWISSQNGQYSAPRQPPRAASAFSNQRGGSTLTTPVGAWGNAAPSTPAPVGGPTPNELPVSTHPGAVAGWGQSAHGLDGELLGDAAVVPGMHGSESKECALGCSRATCAPARTRGERASRPFARRGRPRRPDCRPPVLLCILCH